MPKTWTENAEDELRAEAKIYRDLKPEHLLTSVFIKYFLRDGELTPSEFKASFTDGKDDGGIDALLKYEQDEIERIALIQSKRVQKIDKDEILDIANKIARTIANFEAGRSSKYKLKLRSAYENARGSTENAPLDILICTTASPTAGAKERIREELRDDGYLGAFNISVFYSEDIEDAIEAIDKPRDSVDEDELKRDTSTDVLEYYLPKSQEPKGYLANVFASSISRLFVLHHDKGLFAQNLRTFIPNKKVDDGITDTIVKSPEQFWLKNNGITIACSSCRIDGNRVVLYDFSIINGCQTATKIGKLGINTNADFLVPCKIIQEKDAEQMAAFAEAANAQKPIQDRDLWANSPEQKALKRSFELNDPQVYLGIKRGIRPFTKAQRQNRGLRDWQQLDNKLYGQLVLAFHCQKPFIAFSQSGTIFSSKETYKEVFRRKRNLATEIDVLRLYGAFLTWRDNFLERGANDFQEAIVMQGRFSLLSSCALLIKAKRSIVNVRDIRDKFGWKRELVRVEIDGPLFSTHEEIDLPDSIVNRLNGLFSLLVEIHGSVLDSDTVGKLYKSEDFHIATLTPRLIDRYQDAFLGRQLSEAVDAFN